jgi:hypothetical protein
VVINMSHDPYTTVSALEGIILILHSWDCK